jgi:hypothetical protein
MLNAIGRREVGAGTHRPRARGADGDGPVLHVATRARDGDAHVRVLERWIARDGRAATLVLLRQEEPLPATLRAACAEAGAVVLALPHGDLLQRARDLRALGARHELVVLHVAPWDVVAALAFADGAGRPPTIRCDHASRWLWLGVGATDVLASETAAAAHAAVTRRGVPAERSLVLTPPDGLLALPSRGTARAALNLPPAAPVLLTVVTPADLTPVLRPSFQEVVAALLEALPQAFALVAGPDADDDLVPRHPRVRALGRRHDLAPLLAAADVLMDPWPAGDPAARREAAAVGLPCLALDGAPDLEAARRRAAALLGRGSRRDGLPTPAVIGAEDSRWRSSLDRVVAAAHAHAGSATPPADGPVPAATDAQAVRELLAAERHPEFSPYHAYAWCAQDLPGDDQPTSIEELREQVDALLGLEPLVA